MTADVRGLVAFALESLRPMQLESGLFCHELAAGDPVPRGRSVRYSLMTYLGLLKAQDAGVEHGFDLERIRAALWDGLDDPALRPGDLGLYLWVDARTGRERGDELLERLEPALAAAGGLARREGMEVAWIVQGLAHQLAAGAPAGAVRRLFDDALAHTLARRDPASDLFLHTGASGFRRRFPNFATQIYTVLALATVAKLGLDGASATIAARAASERLQGLQLDDGAWPWLYDAEYSRVVERYEIYAVHQDAMAPMALLQLAEATGERSHVEAAGRGLEWIYGRNELGVRMIDPAEKLLFRSIRRRRPWDRLALYAATAGASAARAAPALPGPVEVDRTDRPYHLGWVLEAWCGREDVLG